jgi:hypothetical protein
MANTATLKLHAPNGSLFLLPSWTLAHIGVAGDGPGHTSLTQASGSVFDPKAQVEALLRRVVESGAAKAIGVGFELDTGSPVGWSSLTDNTDRAIKPTCFVLKQEAPAGSKVASTILALAFVDPQFGQPATQTSKVSAIAPPTSDAAFLPDDVANDAEVLSAMAQGKLHTIVSVFPGPFQINGVPIPRA